MMTLYDQLRSKKAAYAKPPFMAGWFGKPYESQVEYKASVQTREIVTAVSTQFLNKTKKWGSEKEAKTEELYQKQILENRNALSGLLVRGKRYFDKRPKMPKKYHFNSSEELLQAYVDKYRELHPLPNEKNKGRIVEPDLEIRNEQKNAVRFLFDPETYMNYSDAIEIDETNVHNQVSTMMHVLGLKIGHGDDHGFHYEGVATLFLKEQMEKIRSASFLVQEDKPEIIVPVKIEPIVQTKPKIELAKKKEKPVAEKPKMVVVSEKPYAEEFIASNVIEMKPKSKSRFSKFVKAAAIILVGAMVVAIAFLKHAPEKKSLAANDVKKKTVLVAKQVKHETVKPAVKTKLDSLFMPEKFSFQPFGHFPAVAPKAKPVLVAKVTTPETSKAVVKTKFDSLLMPQTLSFQPFGHFPAVAPKAKTDLLAVVKKPETKKVSPKRKLPHAFNKSSTEMIAKTEEITPSQTVLPAPKHIEAPKAVLAHVVEIDLPIAGLTKIYVDITAAKTPVADTMQTQQKPTAASMDPIGGNGSGMLKIQPDTVKKDTLNKSGILPKASSKIKLQDWQHNFSSTFNGDHAVNKLQSNGQEIISTDWLLKAARTSSLNLVC